MDFWEIIYKIGFAICHQLPERTPVIEGYHLPLCARCTGIYLGVVSGYIYLFITGKWKSDTLPEPPFGYILAGLIGLTFLDALTTFLHLRPECESLRLLTGLLTGASLPTFAYPLLLCEIADNLEEKSNMESWGGFTVFIIIAIIPFALFYLTPPGTFYIISIVSTLGVLLIFMNLFGMLISIFVQPRKPYEYIFTLVLTVFAIFLLFTLLYKLHQFSLTLIGG